MARLVVPIRILKDAFPNISLQIFVEARGTTAEKVLDRSYDFGLSGPLGIGVDALKSTFVWAIHRVVVVAPDHPLARWGADIPADVPADVLGAYVQLLTLDRSGPEQWRDYGLVSPATWRVGDLAAKHEMLRGGLGWGSMPAQIVEDDLRSGRLVTIKPDGREADRWSEPLPVYAIHRADAHLGPAARCLLAALKDTVPAKSSAACGIDPESAHGAVTGG